MTYLNNNLHFTASLVQLFQNKQRHITDKLFTCKKAIRPHYIHIHVTFN